ncbi:MAG: ribonuclease PH, partial [Thermoguttaceae bacterium]|nr:ribonuclease PH [Thermoguttaceae bacterium]
MTIARADGRTFDQLRPIKIQRGFTNAAGSVLISSGATVALCTASVVEDVPDWKKRGGELPTSGWLTAEYRMLPGSTKTRKPRQDRPDGRATEIQRLIGRSLRAVFD